MNNELLLSNIRKHVPLANEEWQFVAGLITERNFKRGALINKEGEVNRFTNFIEKGSARVYYINGDGQEHVVQLGIRNWWTGDFPSFITQQKGMLFTEALEQTTLQSISYENLQIIYKRIPVFERFFRLMIQNAYASFQYRLLHNLSMDAEQRYLVFTEMYPDMEEQISQKHIASYLGMSAEFLSRIKKRVHERKKNKKQSL